MKFFQHGGGRHLGFVRIVNSAVRSAVPENPTLEPNMKWIGSPVAEIWPFAYVGVNTALCTKVHRAVKSERYVPQTFPVAPPVVSGLSAVKIIMCDFFSA